MATQVEIPEKITSLIREVISNPDKYPEEAKYLLKIERWSRRGPAYSDWGQFKIIKGKAIEVEVGGWEEPYPGTSGTEYIIIPLELGVVVEFESFVERSPEDSEYEHTYYVFTDKGWKKVVVERRG